MKIHSDIFTRGTFHDALPKKCTIVELETAGSRQRKSAFMVRISGSSKYNMDGLPHKAATYDEWGWFLKALFTIDPRAICGPYKGVADFHNRTSRAFV